LRRIVGIDLGNEPVPDETTIYKFRHLLETHDLDERIFQEVNAHLKEKGLKLSEGTIMDATIINAPSSTKKGNQYYFGMKIHVGVDRESRTVHSLVTTPANVHDSKMVEDEGKEKLQDPDRWNPLSLPG
ncbi:MAG: transposase, partial [Synergistaceae bacterium]|nr:transposase [Synergistaceae bacterium]